MLPTLAEGRGVVVAGVDNHSTEPDAGLIVARYAGQGLAARGLSGRSDTSLSLLVTIESLDADPVAAGGLPTTQKLPQRVALWRARGQLWLRVVDTAQQPEKVVASSRVSGSEEFQSGDDIEATEVSRSLATERLLERLVRDGLDMLK